jgi:hypothetical protein
MADCAKCSQPLYRCKKCGNIGCAMPGCRNQGFKLGFFGCPCLKCRSADQERIR